MTLQIHSISKKTNTRGWLGAWVGYGGSRVEFRRLFDSGDVRRIEIGKSERNYGGQVGENYNLSKIFRSEASKLFAQFSRHLPQFPAFFCPSIII